MSNIFFVCKTKNNICPVLVSVQTQQKKKIMTANSMYTDLSSVYATCSKCNGRFLVSEIGSHTCKQAALATSMALVGYGLYRLLKTWKRI